MSWERDADERITRHRTGDLDITAVDGQGEPIPGVQVELAMQRHAFGFGSAINAEYLLDAGKESPYRRLIPKLFNKAVLENRHKWGFWEDTEQREIAERATQWLLEHGLEMRGHTCIWQKRDQGAIPSDVVRAMDDGDGEHIEERAREHIERIVGHYRDVDGFTEWDVLNEPVEEHEMTEIIAERGETAVIAEWFRAAKQADPDARLFLNEYSVLAGDEREHKEALEALVKELLDEGVPVEGLGLQAHHWRPDQRRTPEQLMATLDRFAALGPVLQIQEYDTWGEGWNERMEAEYLYRFLKLIYSHPAVTGFLMWGFWDGIHWHGNAPLFRADWSKKPAYDTYTDLVFDQWWTEEAGRTDGEGVYSTRAFLGEYELTARTGGIETKKTATVADPSERTTITIRVDRSA